MFVDALAPLRHLWVLKYVNVKVWHISGQSLIDTRNYFRKLTLKLLCQQKSDRTYCIINKLLIKELRNYVFYIPSNLQVSSVVPVCMPFHWGILCGLTGLHHYNDVIMVAIASQITSLSIVFPTVYSDADQRKHQSSASLAFVQGIHRWPVNQGIRRWPVNSPHKWPVTRKMFPYDDVIMSSRWLPMFDCVCAMLSRIRPHEKRTHFAVTNDI